MKRARSYWKPTSTATVESFRQGRRRRVVARSQVRQGVKPSAYCDAALQAAEACDRAHLLDDVDAVVVAQPGELALVRLEHRDLRLDRRGHVDVLGGVEAEPHHGVHEVDRRHRVVVGALGLEQRQRRVEAAVEDELRRLVVVGHVVAGGVRDDQIGAHLADEIDDGGALVVVARVDFSVGEAERDVRRRRRVRRRAAPRAAGSPPISSEVCSKLPRLPSVALHITTSCPSGRTEPACRRRGSRDRPGVRRRRGRASAGHCRDLEDAHRMQLPVELG